MKIKLHFLIYLLLLTGCIEGKIVRQSQENQILVGDIKARLKNATSCCVDYSKFSYGDIQSKKRHEVVLGASSSVYDFPFGKSRFQAYSLPRIEHGDSIVVTAIELYSGSKAKAIFRPRAFFVDKNYMPLAQQPTMAFDKFHMGATTEGHNSRIDLYPDYSEAKYLIIAADPSFVGGNYTDRAGTRVIPAGGALIGMSIPERKFPYGYEGKGFVTYETNRR
ncbi:MAG: hypothetical protein WKG03_22970 [Telluria sp.]